MFKSKGRRFSGLNFIESNQLLLLDSVQSIDIKKMMSTLLLLGSIKARISWEIVSFFLFKKSTIPFKNEISLSSNVKLFTLDVRGFDWRDSFSFIGVNLEFWNYNLSCSNLKGLYVNSVCGVNQTEVLWTLNNETNGIFDLEDLWSSPVLNVVNVALSRGRHDEVIVTHRHIDDSKTQIRTNSSNKFFDTFLYSQAVRWAD